ncbi:hypothetical protein X753_06035 [Mesorhizobium sp. LNJC399B00]|uniref:hypothetical protein n=1 Tax=unclassified Mesorhizobium TaxID=325217 RepID=UPI0003CF8D3F|nr:MULTISPECIES: hypothetical protein [unclassified Mesorhizobium]ESY08699.1 hypothetical protein X753_06035 [Mesorhizobium sp. LNJC399B00]WJI69848.1 hypothetical protein NLY36_03310 [Mesorhizobium sp. C399B]
MPKNNTDAEFYEALGLAIFQWSRVESAYCDLFQRLILCAISGGGIGSPTGEGFFILGNVFNATSNFRGRLDLIGHMIKRLVKDDALLAEWNAIKNKAGTLYARRNILAHGEAWHRENSEAVQFIRYSVFSTNEQEMDYQQIVQATPSFYKYAERVKQLAIDVNTHLAKRKYPAEHPAH